MLLSLFSELPEIDVNFFGSKKLIFEMLLLELQVVFQNVGFEEFFLDNLDILDLSDHINITGPAWNSLVDFFCPYSRSSSTF